MSLTDPARVHVAFGAGLAVLLATQAALAGIATHDAGLASPGLSLQPVQYGYGYGYGYGYRPYGFRPYGYYPNRRFYNNHFGPGAAKERHRTRLDYCIKQPSKC